MWSWYGRYVKPAREKAPFDPVERYHREMGLTLPEEFLDEVRSLSYVEAMKRFRRAQQDRILAWLREMGVACDAAAVRRVLAWEGVTERESDSDIGNLPRLLSVLGLGGQWDEFVAQAENPPPEPVVEPEPPPPPPQVVAELEKRLAGLLPVQAMEGSAVLPLKRLHRIGFLADACRVENTVGALLTVSLPEGWTERVPEREPPQGDVRTELLPTRDGFRLGFENYRWLDRESLRNQFGKKFAAFLRRLPEGTTLECALAAADEPATRQVYRGVMRGEDWHIEATYPSVPGNVLQEALDLARRSEKTKHRLRDTEEVQAVLEAARKDPFLAGMGVKSKGLLVGCEYDIGHLAALILRLRFRQWWDFGPVERHAEEYHRQKIEQGKKFRKAAVQAARSQMAPRLGEPIFRGRASTYWQSDLSHCGELGDLLEAFEKAMGDLGFTLLGDLTSKKFRDYVLRCYLAPDRLAYADLTASRYGVLCWEYCSQFEDGSRHTTTTTPLASSRPAVGLYYKDYPGMPPEELYRKHQWCLDRFRTARGTAPVPLEPNLAGPAAMLDETIVRTEEDERNNVDADEDD